MTFTMTRTQGRKDAQPRTYQIKQSYVTCDYFTVEADSPEQAREVFNKEGGDWLGNIDGSDCSHQIEEVTLYE